MNTKLKIGMIIPSFRPIVGGAERQLEGLLKSLKPYDAKITVFTRMASKSLKYEQSPNYELYRLNSFIPKIVPPLVSITNMYDKIDKKVRNANCIKLIFILSIY